MRWLATGAFFHYISDVMTSNREQDKSKYFVNEGRFDLTLNSKSYVYIEVVIFTG